MKSCVKISIKGIVQGVGFRPFVYNLSRKYNLCGYVLNNTSGVSIEVEGDRDAIDEFLRKIQEEAPPQAVIFEITRTKIDPVGYTDFQIRKSDDAEEKFVPISPEIATCKDCLKEIFDPKDRRYRYPFTNCTNCGPRFTIVRDIPYDRPYTTMAPFVMCENCRKEYDNPEDRRFHAQPNACPVCGPQLSLLDNTGKKVSAVDVIEESCRLLKQGKILAIKGLGGYHLACDAMNREAVSALRARKYREFKPFAIMAGDTATARKLCRINPEEEKLLAGTIRPILLLKKKSDGPVAEDVSPNQKYHGVMLPYTPLHHLLVKESGLVLVMTSGNISSEPIVYRDEEGLDRLKGIADYYVVHNREIHIRTDDSVVRICHGKEKLLRRSRGYAPFPIRMTFPFRERILACGAELKNTFCLTRDRFAFLSHHIGDLENMETLVSFEQGIEHFKRIFNIEPSCVAYDLHPEYLSTKYALSLADIPKIGVQHHHAHIASCMGDNDLEGEVIGVAFDGTGFGVDGKIWGGEFFVCSKKEFTRVAHLDYAPLPGGEKAIREPWRIAASYLYKSYGRDMNGLPIDFIKNLDLKKWSMIEQMIQKGINSPMTSSAGRLFDAVSALIGVRREVYYEGQAAIELEMAADQDETGMYGIDFTENEGQSIILLEPLIRDMVSDILNGIPGPVISGRFHNTVARMILELCKKIRSQSRLDRVALSGGVFQNSLLFEKVFTLLDKNGFLVYSQARVPPNDGGIALGQAIIANEKIASGGI